MRNPWFTIIEIIEPRGRPIAEIAAEVARTRGVSLAEMRGARLSRNIAQARREALARIRIERPDVQSHIVARYFHREGSTIRHAWCNMAELA